MLLSDEGPVLEALNLALGGSTQSKQWWIELLYWYKQALDRQNNNVVYFE